MAAILSGANELTIMVLVHGCVGHSGHPQEALDCMFHKPGNWKSQALELL